MPVHERRQHFRVDDHIYFDYKEVGSGELCSDLTISKELLGDQGLKYMESVQYFHDIDLELSELTQSLALEQPAIAHYLNLINAKIEYLSRQIFVGNKLILRKVNMSLGGMAFKTEKKLDLNCKLKLIIYTKPKMVPIIINAKVVHCDFQDTAQYRTAVEFEQLTLEQEQLLSQHIMQAQIKGPVD